MEIVRDPAIVERVRRLAQLYDLSERIARHKLRRADPDASHEQIEARMTEWRHRPVDHGGNIVAVRVTNRFPDSEETDSTPRQK